MPIKSRNPHRPAVPANDNGEADATVLDPRFLRIAEAIGRHLARQHLRAWREQGGKVANDNQAPSS